MNLPFLAGPGINLGYLSGNFKSLSLPPSLPSLPLFFIPLPFLYLITNTV